MREILPAGRALIFVFVLAAIGAYIGNAAFAQAPPPQQESLPQLDDAAFVVTASISSATSETIDDQGYEEYAAKGCLLTFGDLELPLVPGQKPERLVELSILQNTLGTPLRLEPSTFRDHYNNDPMDSIKVIYEFIEVEATRLAGSEAAVWNLVGLTIREDGFDLPCGLKVGEPASRFLELLGEPLLSSTEELIDYEWLKLEESKEYEGALAAWHAAILLSVSPEGKVTQIAWRWYSD